VPAAAGAAARPAPVLCPPRHRRSLICGPRSWRCRMCVCSWAVPATGSKTSAAAAASVPAPWRVVSLRPRQLRSFSPLLTGRSVLTAVACCAAASAANGLAQPTASGLWHVQWATRAASDIPAAADATNDPNPQQDAQQREVEHTCAGTLQLLQQEPRSFFRAAGSGGDGNFFCRRQQFPAVAGRSAGLLPHQHLSRCCSNTIAAAAAALGQKQQTPSLLLHSPPPCTPTSPLQARIRRVCSWQPPSSRLL
jgi:hypothetical protein